MYRLASIFAGCAAAGKAAEIASARLRERGIVLAPEGGFRIEFSLCAALPENGFELSAFSGVARVAAADPLGFLHGAGKLLRALRYGENGFEADIPCGRYAPRCSVRGIYFASHFHNYYINAPFEEIRRYIEDLALWGFNYLDAILPSINLRSEDDEEVCVCLLYTSSLKRKEHTERTIWKRQRSTGWNSASPPSSAPSTRRAANTAGFWISASSTGQKLKPFCSARPQIQKPTVFAAQSSRSETATRRRSKSGGCEAACGGAKFFPLVPVDSPPHKKQK